MIIDSILIEAYQNLSNAIKIIVYSNTLFHYANMFLKNQQLGYPNKSIKCSVYQENKVIINSKIKN